MENKLVKEYRQISVNGDYFQPISVVANLINSEYERQKELIAELIAEITENLFGAVIESNSKILSVGWFPEFDPAGSYHVQLLSGEFAEQIIEEKIVGTPQEVVVILEEFAKFHDETQIPPCQ